MDEKMNSVLKGIYDSLTEEQKERAKNIQTMENLTKFAAKEGIELPEDVLEAVAGGGSVPKPECLTMTCPWHAF